LDLLAGEKTEKYKHHLTSNQMIVDYAVGAYMYALLVNLDVLIPNPKRQFAAVVQTLPHPVVDKEQFDDMMCYMEPCVACEIKIDKDK
jgi:hypothetical protein